jgi:hypothetical protein
MDVLLPLLERNGYRLTGSSHQGQYISIVLKQEIDQIKEELAMPGNAGLTSDISVILQELQILQ